MARVFRTSYLTGLKDNRVRRRSRKWYVEYRDADGITRRVAGYTDKAATQQLAAELERGAERGRAGLIDKYAEHRKRRLVDHLDDWHHSLLNKGTTDKHADLVKLRADRVLRGCRFTQWADISASAVQRFLASLRDEKLSAQTRNFYLGAVKQFCRWMVMDQRAETNPLQHLQGENVKLDRHHDRADFNIDELRRLVTVAHNGPDWRGIPGPERSLVYRLVAETGLRANEVRTLTVESLSLDGAEPTVTVEAGYSKRRQQDTLPVRPDLAVVLRENFSGKLPQAVAFKMPPPSDVARMLRSDLERAGIPYKTPDGKVRDFHALRHTFGTLLKRAGVHPKDAQMLMRHSTITLTMDRYTHGVVGDLTAALQSLPRLRSWFGRGNTTEGNGDGWRGILYGGYRDNGRAR